MTYLFEVELPDLASATPMWLSLLTVGVNGAVGALHGLTDEEGRWDIVGVTTFALVMGLGGGFIRDMLLGRPAQSLRSPWFLVVIGFSVLLVWVWGARWVRLRRVMLILDAVALGLFAVVGAAAADFYGLPSVSSVLVGTISAVGGGVIVAVLQGRTAAILEPSEPYALLAVLASMVYLALASWNEPAASFAGVGSAVLAQLVVRRWGIRTRSSAVR